MGDPDTEKRQCENGSREWRYVATSQATLGAPEAGRGKEGLFLRAFGGRLRLPTPWFPSSGL